MSINRNRCKLNKAKTSKEYLVIQYDINYPLYYEEGICFKGRLMKFEQRMCRTWKHTRKVQWKQ